MLVRLSQIDPNGLVPLVKQISRLEKCDPKPTHFLHTAALGGWVEEMGPAGSMTPFSLLIFFTNQTSWLGSRIGIGTVELVCGENRLKPELQTLKWSE